MAYQKILLGRLNETFQSVEGTELTVEGVLWNVGDLEWENVPAPLNAPLHMSDTCLPCYKTVLRYLV